MSPTAVFLPGGIVSAVWALGLLGRIGFLRVSNDTRAEERSQDSSAGEGESRFRHVEGALC